MNTSEQRNMADEILTQGRSPSREEARIAARVLRMCNGYDLDVWTDGEWNCDDDGLRALIGHPFAVRLGRG